jgi:hypothetical protein
MQEGGRWRRHQGCSTLLTEAPLGQSIKPRQSGGVPVLTEGADFIPTQHVQRAIVCRKIETPGGMARA